MGNHSSSGEKCTELTSGTVVAKEAGQQFYRLITGIPVFRITTGVYRQHEARAKIFKATMMTARIRSCVVVFVLWFNGLASLRPLSADGHLNLPLRAFALAAMPAQRSTRAGILPGCPSLDRGSRKVEVGFEPRTFRDPVGSVNAGASRHLRASLPVIHKAHLYGPLCGTPPYSF
ncbi:hypothetical protein CSKR_102535, partial [Clonorchis sinensis]